VYMKPELAKVGPAWEGGDIEKWPGVAGVAGQTNHLAQNLDPFLPDPENTSSNMENQKMSGGKRSRHHRRRTSKHKSKSKRGRHTKSKRGRHTKSKRGRHTKSKRGRHTKSKRGRHTKSKRRYRGGSKHGRTLLPQSLVNLGRNLQYNGKSTWSSFMGEQQPVNPDPLVQPIGM
jgi:hypothetical protein